MNIVIFFHIYLEYHYISYYFSFEFSYLLDVLNMNSWN